MRRKVAMFGLSALLGTGAIGGAAAASAQSGSTQPAVAFKDARLKIEYNATDGDAGLQIFVDADAWREISITNPAGKKIVDVEAESVIRNYGLTELFSESSEPPFTEFPFARFKQLFPEGRYTFLGRGIDGVRLTGTFTLSHTVPDGPTITSPVDGATVTPAGLVVRWQPVTSPAGVDVVAYQVLVVADAPGLGNPKRVFDAVVPGSATSLPIPAEFLVPGTYKSEVRAIDRSGNQTLTEVAFTVAA